VAQAAGADERCAGAFGTLCMVLSFWRSSGVCRGFYGPVPSGRSCMLVFWGSFALSHADSDCLLISVRALYHRMIGDPEHRESRFLRILRVFGVVIGVASSLTSFTRWAGSRSNTLWG